VKLEKDPGEKRERVGKFHGYFKEDREKALPAEGNGDQWVRSLVKILIEGGG
jgi:hypothetical protein